MNPRPPGVERGRLHLVQWPSIAYLGAMTLKHLGKTSALPASPQEAVLDYVPNPRPDAHYLVRFAAPEFTSLCPVTGQTDFAPLVSDYAAGDTIVDTAEDRHVGKECVCQVRSQLLQ